MLGVQGVAIKLANLPGVVRKKLDSLGKHLETTIDGLPYGVFAIKVLNNKSLVVDCVSVDSTAEDNPDTKILKEVWYWIKRVGIFAAHASTVPPVFAFAGKNSPG